MDGCITNLQCLTRAEIMISEIWLSVYAQKRTSLYTKNHNILPGYSKFPSQVFGEENWKVACFNCLLTKTIPFDPCSFHFFPNNSVSVLYIVIMPTNPLLTKIPLFCFRETFSGAMNVTWFWIYCFHVADLNSLTLFWSVFFNWKDCNNQYCKPSLLYVGAERPLG